MVLKDPQLVQYTRQEHNTPAVKRFVKKLFFPEGSDCYCLVVASSMQMLNKSMHIYARHTPKKEEKITEKVSEKIWTSLFQKNSIKNSKLLPKWRWIHMQDFKSFK